MYTLSEEGRAYVEEHADEALAFGLVDKVFETRPDAEKSEA